MNGFALLLIVGATIAIPTGGRAFFRRREAHMIEASAVWDRLAENVGRLIDDESCPRAVVSFAYMSAMLTGCGCFARGLVIDHLRIRFGKARMVAGDGSFTKGLGKLNAEQRGIFKDVVKDILLFDCLHTMLTGWIVRRLIWGKAFSSQALSRPVREREIRRVAVATRHVAVRKNSDTRAELIAA